MDKLIIVFGWMLLVMTFVAFSSQNRCRPICRKDLPSRVVCARDGKLCRRIPLCNLLEANCRRRGTGREPLITTSILACRNIKTPLDSGTCAPIRKPRQAHRHCDRIRCTNPGGELHCYRSRLNMCQRLTSCQLERVNCRRGHGNHLERTRSHACAGMRRGEELQRCRRHRDEEE